MRMMLSIAGATALATPAMAQVWGGLSGITTIESSATDLIHCADLNGDGIDDIVAATASGGDVSVYLSTGPDTFAPAVVLNEAGLNSEKLICLSDIDGDLDIDVVGVAAANLSDVRTWLNDGAGNFSVGQTILDTMADCFGVTMGDINGDDSPDLLVRGLEDVRVLLNDGFGVFGAPTVFAAPNGGGAGGIAAINIDGDDYDDVAVAARTANVIRILKSDGASLVEVQSIGAPLTPYDVEAGDMDGDGDIDLVSASRDSGAAIRVYLNDGSGVFSIGVTAAIGGLSESLELVDLDADSDLDVVAASLMGNASVRLFFNDGTGAAFGTEDYPSVGVSGVKVVSMGDLNGNGSPDLLFGITTSSNPGMYRRLNQTDVLLPGAFDLVSPANNSVALPLPETLAQWPGGKAGTAPLKWTTATGFQNTYTVRIARDAAFTDVVLEQTDDASPFNVPDGLLEIGKRYYWTVDVENPIGLVSATSGSFTFLMRALADLNADGQVSGADLAILLSSWGVTE